MDEFNDCVDIVRRIKSLNNLSILVEGAGPKSLATAETLAINGNLHYSYVYKLGRLITWQGTIQGEALLDTQCLKNALLKAKLKSSRRRR